MLWMSVDLMNTLTMSAAPLTASTATESAKFFESPNPIMLRPYSITA